MKSYSRLARTEQQKNIKKTYRYILLTFISLIIFFFLGIPAIVKLISITTDITNSASSIDISDNTPPIKPDIQQTDEYTNKKVYLIIGQTEPAAIVKLSINGRDEEILANAQGEFSFSATLKEGKNNIYAVSIDDSGNESQRSDTLEIFYDITPPEINLTSPQDGQEFFGSGQKLIEIKGSTEVDAQVMINNRFANISDSGEFSHDLTLSDGDNEVIIIVKDKAGNETEKKLLLKYSP